MSDVSTGIDVYKAIRILDVMCRVDGTLVVRAAPVLRKVLAAKPSSLDDGRVVCMLAALQFFVDHGAAVSVDFEVSGHG